MQAGEIISIVAVLISFLSLVLSQRKADREREREREQEREISAQNFTTFQKDIETIGTNVSEIKQKVEKIDDKMNNDHAKIVDHEARLKNLEKEVFKRSEK